jgi:hypothetical protein
MNAISDIKIISIDEERPPQIRKEAYIDVFFKLSMKAPEDWCDDFNALGRKINPAVKMDIKQGIIIEAWVKDMADLPPQLEKIKLKVKECNEQYIEKTRLKALAMAASVASKLGQGSKQQALNDIVATLKFDD